MSIAVAPEELAEALTLFGSAYLLTVGTDPVAHVSAVTPTLADGRLHVTAVGRRTRANLELHPTATLVWPPAQPDGYSLIVDGAASLTDEDVTLTPTRAVLHRPAPAPTPVSTGDCASDCVELAPPAHHDAAAHRPG